MEKVRTGIKYRSNGSELVAYGTDILRELVVPSTANSFAAVVSCNPRLISDQQGGATRLCRQAMSFANYRPIKFEVEYIPVCPTTTAGALYMGSMWGDASYEPSSLSALMASNGGHMCQIAQHGKSTIKMNLPQKYFSMEDSHDIDSEPFVFVATITNATAAAGTSLGMLLLHWEYVMLNPTVASHVSAETANQTVSVNGTGSTLEKLAITLSDSAAKWSSILLESVPSTLSNHLKPGLRYFLESLGSNLYSILDDTFQPIMAQSTLATTIKGNLGYVIDMVSSPSPVVLENQEALSLNANDGVEEQVVMKLPSSAGYSASSIPIKPASVTCKVPAAAMSPIRR